ncbi:hypothetical protein FPJ27_26315 [Burkholderia sp. MS455]|uniref:hypothetical protein n=1 Tax=Burkholderia sp. MS455 TaxID=2811788 RepID=UPI00195909F1|nr:hypothetical protein [Burkholderia sp. MS455]QRR09746.1 hypothetical protein FPJ27_26315 [Burkholderia sp. MS455]
MLLQTVDTLIKVAHLEYLRDLRQRENEARAILTVNSVQSHVPVDARHFASHSVEVVQVDCAGEGERGIQSPSRSPPGRLWIFAA